MFFLFFFLTFLFFLLFDLLLLLVKLLELCGSYAGSVHIGGDLSMTDMLIALYHHAMNVDPKDIKLPTRDRFVLSKGHGAIAMYAAMAMRGFFDWDEIVRTYGKLDSAYGMHPCKVHLPGVECSSGSLGHGMPMAVGMAISAKQKKEEHRVFCIVGDMGGRHCRRILSSGQPVRADRQKQAVHDHLLRRDDSA